MTKEALTGLGVNTFYGPRTNLEGMGGHVGRNGAVRQAIVEFSGKNINDGAVSDLLTIVAPARIEAVYLHTLEAATMTGTTPTILVGTDGSVATDNVTISEAQVEATGTYDITDDNGDWAADFETDVSVSIELGGTTPTITDDGHFKLVIDYFSAYQN